MNEKELNEDSKVTIEDLKERANKLKLSNVIKSSDIKNIKLSEIGMLLDDIANSEFKIEIPLSEEDIEDLKREREHNWNFNGMHVRLYNSINDIEDEDEDE